MKPGSVAFLLDVDNTLLDNDRIEADIGRHLEHEFGPSGREQYWKIFEDLRQQLGYADYLGAVQRFRLSDLNEPRMLMLSAFLLDFPFAQCLYPAALDVLRHLGGLGQTLILSDGDGVFQPRKVQRSGLWDAVGGRVMIYIHKEQMLQTVIQRYPAGQYVMIDDKPRVLHAMKRVLESRLTTVWVRQGHYALQPEPGAHVPEPDMTVEHIGTLLDWNSSTLSGLAGSAPPVRQT